MLKPLYLTAALLAVLTPLALDIAFSEPASESSRYPVVPNSDIDKPVCYMQTTQGSTLNLNSICGKANVKPVVCPEITDPKEKAAYIEFYGNTPQALATLGCNPPPPPKYLPEDGSTPG